MSPFSDDACKLADKVQKQLASRRAAKAAAAHERLAVLEMEAHEAGERLRRLYKLVEDGMTEVDARVLPCPCPSCGGRMIVIEVFARGCEPKYRPTPAPTPIRIDTS